MKNRYKVAIRCLTYNHSEYILDTLSGFVMQQTDFPFIILTVDDASVDGAQKVINDFVAEHFDLDDQETSYRKDTEYAEITYARHKTNLNCHIALLNLKYNHYQIGKKKMPYLAEWRDVSEYEALCEGDDYWTDQKKLQKQVDYLDGHQDVHMCYTDFDILNQRTGQIRHSLFTTEPSTFRMTYQTPEEFVYRAGYVCPPSWLYRRTAWPEVMVQSMDGTFTLFTHFLATGKVHAMPDVTAVYRILPESASHSADISKNLRRARSIYDTQCRLIDKYGLSQDLKQKCAEKYYRHHLAIFVAGGATEEIAEYRRMIKDKSLKDRILLLLAKTRLGSSLLKQVYRIHLKNKN